MALGDLSAQVERILNLIKVLTSDDLSGPQIVERLSLYYGASGTRLVRADITMLNAWGFDIQSQGTPPRYKLLMNPLTIALDDAHVDALALIRTMFGPQHPLSPPFTQLLQLLTTSLNDDQRARYHQQPVVRLDLRMATSYPELDQHIRILRFAIMQQRQVQFAYRSLDHRHHALRHLVDPYEIEYHQQHLYLVGYSHQNRGLVDFRLDQIVGQSLQSLPTPITHADRDLYPYVFRYRLAAKLAQRGISERFANQQIIQTFPNGDVEIEAHARSQFYAIRGLLRYADSASATAPTELVETLKATLERMRAQYED